MCNELFYVKPCVLGFLRGVGKNGCGKIYIMDTLIDNGIRGHPMRDGHSNVYK